MEQGSNRGADASVASGLVPEDNEERINRLRRSGISIDREGNFIHEGQRVEHEGLRRALFRWLDRLPDGRHIFRLDADRFAYVEVNDTPLVVRSARADAGLFTLGLSDGTTEALAPSTLTADDQGRLRCWVRGGKLEARFSNSAVAVLADSLFEEGPERALRIYAQGHVFVVPHR